LNESSSFSSTVPLHSRERPVTNSWRSTVLSWFVSSKVNNLSTKGESSKFFNPHKNKTHEFFKDTKIGSCSHVLVNNGSSVAVPFNIKNSKGRGLMSFKIQPSLCSETESIYRKDYAVKPDMHVGMSKKPLVPYHPTSYRNRLPTSSVIMPHKNKSVVEIGDRGAVNRKQWISNNADNFTKPKTLPISNTGIISDMTIRAHKKLNE